MSVAMFKGRVGDLGQKKNYAGWNSLYILKAITKLSGLHLFICIYTLLKIKVLQKILHSDAIEEPFLVPQRTIKSKVIQTTISILPFIIWRTFFHHTEPFVKQKGSSDVKGFLWNHLDKRLFYDIVNMSSLEGVGP